MSLPQFLNWLFGVIDRVIGFFGDRFNIYINILETIGTIISYYVDQAKSFLLDQLNNAKDAIIKWSVAEATKIVDWVIGQFNGFTDWVKSQIAGLAASFTGTVNDVINFINQVSAYVNEAIGAAKAELQSTLQGMINDAIAIVTSNLTWLFDIRNRLIDGISFLTKDLQKKISILTNDYFPVIVRFCSSPIEFTFDIMAPTFISFIGWVIASALGSTEDTLDLTPPWKRGK